jgi:RNA polymerase sigma factor (sigma-70 family)
MSDDARDLAQARSGGVGAHQAFARIYDRHAPVVRALCRTKASEAAADDLLQETFLRAFRLLERVDDPSGLRSWLYAIARLVCREHARSSRREAHRMEALAMLKHADGQLQPDRHGPGGSPGANVHGTPDGVSPPGTAPPPDLAAHAEELEHLSKALDRLDNRERLAIHLYYLESDPVATAQDALGLSRSAFYKLLSKAKEHLHALMVEAAT